MTKFLTITKRVPLWGWVTLALISLFAFGETKVSVGNVSVGGKDLGGFEHDSNKN